MKEFPDQAAQSHVRSIDQKIIGLFRKYPGKIVSGEELGTALNISRTAVWKHIKTLQELGFRIEAVPSQGYRLLSSPDILIAEEITSGLTTGRIGKKIICFRKTDSTNQIAFKLAEQEAEEGTVVIAEEQSHGKGRLGRHWESPYGVNLYCSIILRPPILPAQAAQFTFLSAVAVAKAIETTTSLTPRIKWPNDVLVNGMKVSGMLNEMSAETEKINFIVLGIGVNINMRREQFPKELRHPASSLYLESGKPVDRTEFTRTLLTDFDFLYEDYLRRGVSSVKEQLLARSAFMGKKVKVSFHDRESFGIAAGLDDDGALLLQLSDGKIEKVLAGDVHIL
ncbi:MAG TPA: biotin--[acetyl-CoA-carboxylase] ligase [Geobacteraceae bacterium]|nr:biotin--[acetyl-CoA-carboxylase] ligase [Geobacteraceae bacterium]